MSPNVYNEYLDLKKAHGALRAQEILRFRLAHISSLIAVAEEEDLLDASQARVVEDFDAFLNPEMFGKAKGQLEAFLLDVPKDLREGFDVIAERETIEVRTLQKTNPLSSGTDTKIRNSNLRLLFLE